MIREHQFSSVVDAHGAADDGQGENGEPHLGAPPSVFDGLMIPPLGQDCIQYLALSEKGRITFPGQKRSFQWLSALFQTQNQRNQGGEGSIDFSYPVPP